MSSIAYQRPLPLVDGLQRWAKAAGMAGAMLPAYVRDCLLRLDWEAEGVDRVDMYDIVEAVADACRECQEQHVAACDGVYAPSPRGVDLHCRPDGGVSIVWESDSHVVTLRFVAELREPAPQNSGFSSRDGGGILREYVVLSCETEHSDSDRLRACRGSTDYSVPVEQAAVLRPLSRRWRDIGSD